MVLGSIIRKIVEISKSHKRFNSLILDFGTTFLSKHDQVVLAWKLSDGENTFRINYTLDNNSVVFDVGGYKGDWTEKIYHKYHCYIYVFEPVRPFASNIKKRFKNISKVHVVPAGLGVKYQDVRLFFSDDATSQFRKSGKIIEGKLVNIEKFIYKNKIKKIDLIKINIEGAEYDLLDFIIQKKLLHKFNNIQIQFHSHVKNFKIRYTRICRELRKSYELTFCYPFVWENWKKIK